MNNDSINSVLMQMRIIQAQSQGLFEPEITEQSGAFPALLRKAVEKVNESQLHAKDLAESFEIGSDDIDLSEVMVASQKSGIYFQGLMQVRNKLVSAYQDIMNMPV